MKNNIDVLIEFGEISRQPIGKKTLLNHWMTINKAMYADRTYKFIYHQGGFYELNDYKVTPYGNNKFISEIKLVKCI